MQRQYFQSYLRDPRRGGEEIIIPTRRKFSSYPSAYGLAFMNAVSSPFSIPCSSPEAARIYRSHLYAFRSAALSELPKGKEELILILPQARTRIRRSVLTIYYDDIHRDMTNAITGADNSNRSDLPVEDRQ